MVGEHEFRAYVKYMLKREMQKSVTSVEQLAVKLNMDSQVLHNKIFRASFSAVFLVRVFYLLGCKHIDLSDFEFYTNKLKQIEHDTNETK